MKEMKLLKLVREAKYRHAGKQNYERAAQLRQLETAISDRIYFKAPNGKSYSLSDLQSVKF